MGELTINEKRKIIRREFKQFNQENGFRFVRPNTLLREQKDILQYLQFKIKAGYMKLRNRMLSLSQWKDGSWEYRMRYNPFAKRAQSVRCTRCV